MFTLPWPVSSLIAGMAIPELKPFLLQSSDVRITNRELGKGAYGVVEEVEIPGAVCASKRIHESLLQSVDRKDFDYITSKYVSECKIMSALRHPHIVQFMGVCYLPGSPGRLPSLIMERMETNLHSLLESGTGLTVSLKRSLLLDVARGLHYLHSRLPPITHRDLTATNVLLNSSLVAKIADLGVARIIDLDQLKAKILTTAPGNVIYMPPEALTKVPVYDTSLDIFSFGNIALFTLTQKFPEVDGATVTDPVTEKVTGLSEIDRRKSGFEILNRLFNTRKAYIELTSDCLQNVTKNRPSAKDLVERLTSVPVEDSSEEVLGNLELTKRVLVLKEENKRLSEQVSILSQQMSSMEEDCKRKLQDRINSIEGRLSEAQVAIMLFCIQGTCTLR